MTKKRDRKPQLTAKGMAVMPTIAPDQHPLSVMIAIPAYTGSVSVPCWSTTLYLQQLLIREQIPFEFKIFEGLAYISWARNDAVRSFMESNFSNLLFIDEDVGFDPNIALTMLKLPQELVAGVYPKKTKVTEWPVQLDVDADNQIKVEGGLIRGKYLPTGCMCIKRSVFEKMYAAYPELEYTDPISRRTTYDLFQLFVEDHRPFGDDYGFCHRWNKIGGETWVLPDIDFTHRGRKDFRGNLWQWMLSGAHMPEVVKQAQAIYGYMSEDELVWLHREASLVQSVVELGSWKGRSTKVLIGAGASVMVTAVDHFRGDDGHDGLLAKQAAREDIYTEFVRNIGDAPNLKVLKMDSVAAAAKFKAKSVDMVFIDANHKYEAVLADIRAWLPKCKKLICGHDYDRQEWPGVVQAVHEVFGGHIDRMDTIWYKRLS